MTLWATIAKQHDTVEEYLRLLYKYLYCFGHIESYGYYVHGFTVAG